MSFRRRSSAASFTTALKSLFGSHSTRRPRPLGGLTSVERFEDRKLLALTVTSISPFDGATNVPLTSDLVFTFKENVAKGQGNIYVVRQSTGTTGVAVDVRSSNVTVSGNQVLVDLPSDLQLDNTYSVYIDKGAFLDTSSTTTTGATLLQQNFDFTPRRPFVADSRARAAARGRGDKAAGGPFPGMEGSTPPGYDACRLFRNPRPRCRHPNPSAGSMSFFRHSRPAMGRRARRSSASSSGGCGR